MPERLLGALLDEKSEVLIRGALDNHRCELEDGLTTALRVTGGGSQDSLIADGRLRLLVAT
jgi:hypothetical protein